MMYTVKQLSDLAGVSVRTLHYYDEIGLFPPAEIRANGYRYYSDESIFRLQQILFFREMDFSLSQIKAILDQPDFDMLATLHAHRAALHDRIARLGHLITTIDNTIAHLKGEVVMSKKKLFTGFTPEEEQRYHEEARAQYGAETVDASYKKWNGYTQQQKDQILAEGGAIYTDAVAAMPQGPASAAAQAVIARWHQHLRYFYEPTTAILRGLGQHYVDSPEFAANFRDIHPDLPEFLRDAITHYCAGLAE